MMYADPVYLVIMDPSRVNDYDNRGRFYISQPMIHAEVCM